MHWNFLKNTLFLLLFMACQQTQPTTELTKVYPDYATKNDLPKPTEVLAEPLKMTVALPDSQPKMTQPAIELDYLMGKFDPSTDDRFTKIEAKWGGGKPMFLRKEAYEAFVKMAEAAEKDGVELKIVSATRTFDQQKQIWEAKWTGRTLVGGKNLAKTQPDFEKRALKILEFSSMPSTSRHHWGTDVDLNNLSDGYFTKKNSTGEKIYAWLTAHAAQFGFCQPYSVGRTTGYHEEKWHWSFVPLSKPLLEAAKKQFRDEAISGFLGAETAVKIQAVERYVLSVNPACF